jgi:hypothetical protein
MSHNFCRHLLRAVRREANSDIRKDCDTWGVLQSGTKARPYYVVEGDRGQIVWEGRACCRYDARHNAIVHKMNAAIKDTCAAMVQGDRRDAEIMADFVAAKIKVTREETTPIEWATWRNYYVRSLAGNIVRGYVEVAA